MEASEGVCVGALFLCIFPLLLLGLRPLFQSAQRRKRIIAGPRYLVTEISQLRKERSFTIFIIATLATLYFFGLWLATNLMIISVFTEKILVIYGGILISTAAYIQINLSHGAITGKVQRYFPLITLVQLALALALIALLGFG